MAALPVVLFGTLLFVGVCLGYLYLLTIAGLACRPAAVSSQPQHAFAIAIPAHNEEAVIGATVERLTRLDYPRELYDIHVVADNCTDGTATSARRAGAYCWERSDETHRSKGYALAWLFNRILNWTRHYDAVVVFDADSRVDACFLRSMDAHLSAGRQVIQGHHVIANAAENWLSAAMYVSFALDNLRNRGRSVLGLSSKIMGDGVCVRQEVLERLPWTASGLTEDAEYQRRLLLHGVHVNFAPEALSYGEVPVSPGIAARQRTRWMQGRADVTRRLGWELFTSGLRGRRFAQIDGAIDQLMPSISTLSVLWLACALLQLACGALLGMDLGFFPIWLATLLVLLVVYPIVGCLASHTPNGVYPQLLLAPLFVVWRTVLRLRVRLLRRPVEWIVTPRKVENNPSR